MPDVLYIHPARHGVDPGRQGMASSPYLRRYPFMPVGVIALANLLLQEGLTVKGINYPFELFRRRDLKLRPWIRAQTSVRLVMVDLHWYEHSYGAISVARACRHILPNASILLGGITASLFAGEILESFPEVDFIIRGDAERPLQILVSELARQSPDLSSVPNLSYRSGGQVVENELSYCATPDDLDKLNFVDLDFLENGDRYGEFQFEPTSLTSSRTRPRGHWLCTGRGCTFNCAFCGGGRESHRAFAGRQALVPCSAEKVAEDMHRLQEMGVDQAAPTIDPTILGPKYWRTLFAQLRKRKVNIGIYNEHFQLPSPEFIEDFAQTVDISRSELAFSLLSGSEKVRRINGKSFSNQQLNRILPILRKHQIPLFIYFSLNLPGEDEQTINRTLRVAERIGRYYPPHLLKMINTMHTIDPCSPMSQDPGRFSIRSEMHSFRDYYDYCQIIPEVRPGVAAGRTCGFTLHGGRSRSLERMAQQWNEFCARQPFTCMPVPPG